MSILTSRDHAQEPAAYARSRTSRRAGGAARWPALAVLAAAVAWPGTGLAATPARADTTVMASTTSDEVTPADGACSLREAILYAENLNGSTTDCGTWATGRTTVNVPQGRYYLAAGGNARLVIGYPAPGPIVITGAGTGTFGTIIDASGHSPRLLLAGAGENVTIKNLTLQGGVAYGGGVTSTPARQGDGGGIDNLGTLTPAWCTSRFGPCPPMPGSPTGRLSFFKRGAGPPGPEEEVGATVDRACCQQHEEYNEGQIRLARRFARAILNR